MDPIFSIINYIFERYGQVNIDNTFNSFFDNGTSFPRFIEIIFNEKIIGINENPSNALQKKNNNHLALNFLLDKNSDIANISPTFESEEDRKTLLSLILTKQYFRINHREIISKCNFIIKPLKYQIRSNSNFINIKTIIFLLSALTKGEISIDIEKKEYDEKIMKNIFDVAKVPLVIDKTSFEPQNQFTFYIQILIIYDLFQADIKQLYKQKKHEKQIKEQQNKKILNFENSNVSTLIENDYSDSENEFKDHLSTKKKHGISEIQIENMNDDALLKTINALGSNRNLQFDSLVHAIEKDNMITFSEIIVNEKDDLTFLQNLKKQKKSYKEKVDDLLNFLGKKEPIFNTLVLNFTNQKLMKTSSSLFYTRFLECFFIKHSKNEMFERIKTLLFTEIEEKDTLYPLFCEFVEKPKHMIKMMLDWNVYLALVYFVNNGKIHFDIKKACKDDYSFCKKGIPQIIDENYLKMIKKDYSILYIQLQFIFDKLDKSGFKHFFIESFLAAMRQFSRIKVPKYDEIATDIIPKNIALIEQSRIYREFNASSKQEISPNEQNKEETAKIEIVEPETFMDRQYMKTQHYKESFKLKLKRHPSLKFLPSDEFWISNDDKYSFENGVLFHSKNEKIDIWNNSIGNIVKKYKTIPSSNFLVTPKSEVRFDEIPPQNVKSKLYKFFIYDEQKKKWLKNSSSISQFLEDIVIDKLKIETSLIFISNSYENEVITLNSKLIQCLYPDFDDEIFVYALCGKQLSLLKYKVNLTQNMSSKKPVFLLLYIPESKKKLKNIKTIIYQINYFLSIICDIEMVILNKEYYINQIEMIKDINNIINSYELSVDKYLKLKNHQNAKIKKQTQHDDDEINFVSDEDLFDDNEEEDEDIHNDIFLQMNLELFKKKKNFIILVNSETIHSDYERPLESEFQISIKQQVDMKDSHVIFINVNESDTYRVFFKTLNSLLKTINNNYEEEFQRFDFYEISHINGFYIEMKQLKQRKTQLEEIISKRFLEFREFDENQLNDFDILSNLHHEIIKTYPSIDEEYNNEINKIISSIQNELSKKNKNIFLTEIEESSKNSLQYLTNVINSHDYWPIEDRNNMKKSHENFLNDEFVNIIKYLFPLKIHSLIFEANYPILERQIEEDRLLIDKIFEIFDNKEVKKDNIDEFVNKFCLREGGTNYVVKERENVKEIKILVQAGHLDEVIERDF